MYTGYACLCGISILFRVQIFQAFRLEDVFYILLLPDTVLDVGFVVLGHHASFEVGLVI